jgi:heme/copper-type cytochrome/quinol oxidase subunit 2
MWFAVLGAPVAWGLEFTAGYWATQTQCSVPGQRWNVNVDLWGVLLMGFAFVVATLAGLTALSLFRGTQRADTEDSPPAGRVHFLSIVGMAVTALFILVIVMTGLGIVILPDCHQS